MSAQQDRTVIRGLARRYMEKACVPEMNERRDIWRRINELHPGRPAIHVRGGRCWQEFAGYDELVCTDPRLRNLEAQFRLLLFRMDIDDDFIYEPWHVVRPVLTCQGWGLTGELDVPEEDRGAWKMDHPLKDLNDLSGLTAPQHAIDEEATTQKVQFFTDLFGDILPVTLDRAPAYTVWQGDISTQLGHLRGIEQLMMDMCDDPQGLHRLLAFMRDGILRTHQQADAAGDWCLTSHQNQVMPYGGSLEDPAPQRCGIPQSQLWGYMAAQEYTLVSPAMHDEFLLQYQLPILKRFGQVAYGCCEDLTRKIDMLRQIPNLRRIAVTPVANVARCAEQIGTDYAISYRPNPAQMVCCGFDEGRIRQVVGAHLDAMKGLHIDITLKDIDTCEGDLGRLSRWVQVVRDLVAERE